MQTTIDIDITWGGYYASSSKDGSEFSIFRLLDFNRDAVHVAFYKEKYPAVPDLQTLLGCTPLIGHAPIETKTLLTHDQLILIGGQPLTNEDLEGYRYYLLAHQIPEEMIEEHFAKLLFFSQEPPLLAHLEVVDEELTITERMRGE